MEFNLQYFGGRGSSSGISTSGKEYGTEYTTLYQSGNIKFVRYNDGAATSPMETMTKSRVYVTISGRNELKSITYYDKYNKRYKQVDVGHPHRVNNVPTSPHTHEGYIHDEKGTRNLTAKEMKMVERIQKTWYNYLSRE